MPWIKGQSGNPKGRVKAPEMEILRKAIATVEKRKKKKFFIHAIEQAYDNPVVLIAILKKLLPDMKEFQGNFDAGEKTMSFVVEAIQKLRKGKDANKSR